MLKRKNSTLSLILLITLLTVALVVLFMLPDSIDGEQARSKAGVWDFYFFYSNDTTLIYRGDLTISQEDSLIAAFEIFAPRSTRAEQINARNLKIESDTLRGVLVHDLYKIKGGNMMESFEIIFSDRQIFSGQGKCLEYCAEGTEEAIISWHGTKKNLNSN